MHSLSLFLSSLRLEAVRIELRSGNRDFAKSLMAKGTLIILFLAA